MKSPNLHELLLATIANMTPAEAKRNQSNILLAHTLNELMARGDQMLDEDVADDITSIRHSTPWLAKHKSLLITDNDETRRAPERELGDGIRRLHEVEDAIRQRMNLTRTGVSGACPRT